MCGSASKLFVVIIKSSLAKYFLPIRFGNQKGIPFCEHMYIVHKLIHYDDTKHNEMNLQEK